MNETSRPGLHRVYIEVGRAADLADPDILAFVLSVGILRGGAEVLQGNIPIWVQGATLGSAIGASKFHNPRKHARQVLQSKGLPIA